MAFGPGVPIEKKKIEDEGGKEADLPCGIRELPLESNSTKVFKTSKTFRLQEGSMNTPLYMLYVLKF